MKIAVVGAGSIGMLFAGKLRLAAMDITLITRSEDQAEAIRRDGLTIETSDGIQHTAFEQVHSSESATCREPVDLLLITVKQRQLDSIPTTVKPWISAKTIIVAFQNGWGHGERLQAWFPNHPIWIAVTTEGASKMEKNVVRHTGDGYTWFGAWTPKNSEKRDITPFSPENLAKTFQIAGFHANATENIIVKLWDKLIINSVINPLTGILEVPNGKLLQSVDAEEWMRDLYREAIRVANAEKIDLDEDSLWETVIDVCRRTKHNRSSMLQDLSNGRKTEIDYINGQLLELGRKNGISLPWTEAMVRLVRMKEQLGGLGDD